MFRACRSETVDGRLVDLGGAIEGPDSFIKMVEMAIAWSRLIAGVWYWHPAGTKGSGGVRCWRLEAGACWGLWRQ